MSSFDFSNYTKYGDGDVSVEYDPGLPQNKDGTYPTLQVKYAGPSNKVFRRESVNRQDKLRRLGSSKTKTVQKENEIDATIIELYAKACVVDWDNVFNAQGQKVLYNYDACKAFLMAHLKQGIMISDLLAFCQDAENFPCNFDGSDVTPEGIEAQVGNSQESSSTSSSTTSIESTSRDSSNGG